MDSRTETGLGPLKEHGSPRLENIATCGYVFTHDIYGHPRAEVVVLTRDARVRDSARALGHPVE
jgi:hypothetical protein